MTVPYTKPPLTYQEMVSLLQSRGLAITSIDDAVKFLKLVNYYRFTAYCLPFQSSPDNFDDACSFENVVNLYNLDEKLRNTVLALISPVEIFLRTRMVYEISHGWGSFAHYDTSLFRNDFNHAEWIQSLEEDAGRARETFIEHYRTTYKSFPRLPLWMACEIMTMGSLNQLYRGLLFEPLRRICSIIEVEHEVFRNWVHVINYLRNICAHHGRLWNREFAIKPRIPQKDARWTSLGLDTRHLFSTIVLLEWMCRKSGLPLEKVESVYFIMRDISAMDPKFSGRMGVPAGRAVGMCWEGLP